MEDYSENTIPYIDVNNVDIRDADHIAETSPLYYSVMVGPAPLKYIGPGKGYTNQDMTRIKIKLEAEINLSNGMLTEEHTPVDLILDSTAKLVGEQCHVDLWEDIIPLLRKKLALRIDQLNETD